MLSALEAFDTMTGAVIFMNKTLWSMGANIQGVLLDVPVYLSALRYMELEHSRFNIGDTEKVSISQNTGIPLSLSLRSSLFC